MYGWAPPLQGILVLECVKSPSWGRVSAPAVVAPEALEEWEHSSKGYEHNVCWLAGQQGHSAFVSAGLNIISVGIGIQLEMQLVLPLDRFKQLTERARGYVRHVGFHHRAAAGSFEGMALAETVRGAPEP